MKLLLDECVVNDLKRDLVGHEVTTVVEAGFGGLENGELLRAASGNFEVLITVDRNLPFQQNVGSFQIAVRKRSSPVNRKSGRWARLCAPPLLGAM
jgi:hypothetical protein